MSEPQTINVINQDGDLVAIPAGVAQQALYTGAYRLPTAKEQTDFNNQQKYGESGVEQAKTAAEAFGRGATFGASDVLESKLLNNPEEMRLRREYNPGTAGSFEVAGAIAPTILAPESIAARTPVGLLGRGARLVEHGITGLGERAAALAGEGTLAARGLETAGSIAGKALAGAGEGAAFGAGETVSEKALGNPEPIGESLLANMGYGAMWGGALGSLIGVGESVIPKAAETARAKVNSVYEDLYGRPGVNGEDATPGRIHKWIGKATSSMTGATPEETEKILANPEKYGPWTGPEKTEMSGTLGKGIESIYKEMGDFSQKTTHEIKPQAIENLVEGVDSKPVKDLTYKTLGDLNSAIKNMTDNPDMFPKSMVKEFEEYRDGLSTRSANSENIATHFNGLENLKRQIDERLKSINAMSSLEEKNAKNLLKPIVSGIRKGLEDETVFGRGAAQQSEYNSALKDALDARKDIEQELMRKRKATKDYEINYNKVNSLINNANTPGGKRVLDRVKSWIDTENKFIDVSEKVHNNANVEFSGKKEALAEMLSKSSGDINTVSNRLAENTDRGHGFMTDAFGMMFGHFPIKVAQAVVNHVTNPAAMASKLAAINKASQKVGKGIDILAKKAYEPIITTAEASKEAAKKVFSKEDVDKQIEDIQQKMQSLENTHDKLSNSTKYISRIAPNISNAVQSAMLKGLMFLHSKIPDWSDNSTALPFDDKKPVSKSQNMQWARYYKAVEEPMLVLKDTVNGKINPQGIETLNAVYPALYSQMKQSLMNEIVSKKAKNQDLTIPYQKRIAISSFLGMPLDSSQNPVNVSQNQAILAHNAMQKKAQEQQAMKPTQKGLDNIDIAGRSRTNAQENNIREA